MPSSRNQRVTKRRLFIFNQGLRFQSPFSFCRPVTKATKNLANIAHAKVSVEEIHPFPTRENSIDPNTHRQPAGGSNVVSLLWRFHAECSLHWWPFIGIRQVHIDVLNCLEINYPFGCPVVFISIVAQGSLLPVQNKPSFLPRLDKFPSHLWQVALARTCCNPYWWTVL